MPWSSWWFPSAPSEMIVRSLQGKLCFLQQAQHPQRINNQNHSALLCWSSISWLSQVNSRWFLLRFQSLTYSVDLQRPRTWSGFTVGKLRVLWRDAFFISKGYLVFPGDNGAVGGPGHWVLWLKGSIFKFSPVQSFCGYGENCGQPNSFIAICFAIWPVSNIIYCKSNTIIVLFFSLIQSSSCLM